MNEIQSVPFIAHEAGMARMERTNRRLFIVVIVSIALLFASNAIWLYAWLQYDYSGESMTQDYWQDGNGYNNINTGTQGDVNNGAETGCDEEEANEDEAERE